MQQNAARLMHKPDLQGWLSFCSMQQRASPDTTGARAPSFTLRYAPPVLFSGRAPLPSYHSTLFFDRPPPTLQTNVTAGNIFGGCDMRQVDDDLVPSSFVARSARGLIIFTETFDSSHPGTPLHLQVDDNCYLRGNLGRTRPRCCVRIWWYMKGNLLAEFRIYEPAMVVSTTRKEYRGHKRRYRTLRGDLET
ncbi:hypothetical protein CIB48_g7463 [Xylaria polymorpha]|nr:hypothetical protein CIB48_g7463 [Xylaria polymorpha]